MIKEDPLLLRAFSLAGNEIPLHIACLSGHLDFAMEIIHLRLEFARELNQDGFGHSHTALANGDIDIVKKLLNVDRKPCLLEGKEIRIPLYYAIIKGREHVIREILVTSPNYVMRLP